jgi:transcription-repair coupling factor (superfamily II helicase)
LDRLDYIARQPGRLTVTGAPQGYDAYLAAEAARRRARAGDKGPVLFVALDDAQADAVCRAIAFFAPDIKTPATPSPMASRRSMPPSLVWEKLYAGIVDTQGARDFAA